MRNAASSITRPTSEHFCGEWIGLKWVGGEGACDRCHRQQRGRLGQPGSSRWAGLTTPSGWPGEAKHLFCFVLFYCVGGVKWSLRHQVCLECESQDLCKWESKSLFCGYYQCDIPILIGSFIGPLTGLLTGPLISDLQILVQVHLQFHLQFHLEATYRSFYRSF